MTDGVLDELVRAVSNATRRQILRLCGDGFVSAGDIAGDIDLALASVSEHLKVLRKAGLVELDRDGTRWLYRTKHELVSQVLEALYADLRSDPDRPDRRKDPDYDHPNRSF